MQALEKNGTWEVCQLPAGRRAIKNKWVFRLKRKADGSLDKFKARLVAKGFRQIEGQDFTDIFAPVVKLTSVCALLALAAHFDWEIE